MLNIILAATVLLQPTTAAVPAMASANIGVRHQRISAPVRPVQSRRKKILVVSVGQSNNGLMNEQGVSTSADFSDPRIKELSQGILRQDYVIAPPGMSHVFQHPAQDDSGGMCMRLAGAKALLHKYPVIEEVTMYCGALGGSSVAPGTGEWDAAGTSTQQAINWCVPFMLANPDYQVVFWCSLGATDAFYGMPVTRFEQQMALLAHTLRTNIPGAQNAVWIQGDMPSDLVHLIDQVRPGSGSAVSMAQSNVQQYIPNSVPVTMFDLDTYDDRHIYGEGLRTFGMRVGLATQL